jgi:hypothetical protein
MKTLKTIIGSNRLWHLSLMVVPALLSCILCDTTLAGIIVSIAVASSLEFKDVLYHSKYSFSLLNIRYLGWNSWDWLDWLFTLIGGVIGSLIYLAI